MESKIDRISIFIQKMENRKELSDDQQIMLLGGGDPNDNEDGEDVNNCHGGNCFVGCSITLNVSCPNKVEGCGG